MKWRHRLVNFRYIFGSFFISDFNLFFELFPLLFFSQFDSVLVPGAWCRVPCGAARVQAGGAKYNFADAPDVDNFLDFVIYRCFYKYIYVCIFGDSIFYMEVDRHPTFGGNTFRLCDTRVKNKTYFRHFTLLLRLLLPCPPYFIISLIDSCSTISSRLAPE